MNDVLVTQFKGEVDNQNLEYFCFYHLYADTSNYSSNSGIRANNWKGTKILSGGTFVDGTTEVTGDTQILSLKPGYQYDLLVPKYTTVVSYRAYYSNVIVAMNFSDLWDDLPAGSTVEAEISVQIRDAAACNHYVTGDINKFFKYVSNKTSITSINLSGANGRLSGSIDNMLESFTALISIHIENSGMIGNIATALANMMQSDKATFKGREDSCYFVCDSTQAKPSALPNNFRIYFTGTSTVNLCRDGHPEEIYGTYDIDSNTFTWN